MQNSDRRAGLDKNVQLRIAVAVNERERRRRVRIDGANVGEFGSLPRSLVVARPASQATVLAAHQGVEFDLPVDVGIDGDDGTELRFDKVLKTFGRSIHPQTIVEENIVRRRLVENDEVGVIVGIEVGDNDAL